MTNPSAIVFDLGKVLVDFDYSIAARRISAGGKMSFEEINKYLLGTEVLVRYETGLISNAELFAEVCQTTGFTGTLAEFGGFFADIFTEIPPMVELHATLRRKGFPTYIFSNTNDLAVRHVRNNFPFFSNFDGYIFSHEVRSMKPDVKIYEALEHLTGRHGSELLYIDDRPENVAAGAARGWQTVLHATPKQTKTALQKLGLLNHI